MMILDNKVEVVDVNKYLGTTIDNSLKWEGHCIVTYMKYQQRLTTSETFLLLTLKAQCCPCFISLVSIELNKFF